MSSRTSHANDGMEDLKGTDTAPLRRLQRVVCTLSCSHHSAIGQFASGLSTLMLSGGGGRYTCTHDVRLSTRQNMLLLCSAMSATP